LGASGGPPGQFFRHSAVPGFNLLRVLAIFLCGLRGSHLLNPGERVFLKPQSPLSKGGRFAKKAQGQTDQDITPHFFLLGIEQVSDKLASSANYAGEQLLA